MTNVPEVLALDFAALKAFTLVYRRGSFAAAAQELGMNPSSVSYTIQRVRQAANDPLFVKQGGKTVPTNHCEKLMKIVDGMLKEAEHFRQTDDFDPSSAVGEISLNSTSFETFLVLPQVVQRIRNEAPGIKLTLYNNYGSAEDILLNGEIDIYMGPQKVSESGIYGREFLTRDEHLCMMDPSNPLAGKSRLSLEDIKNMDHAGFEPRPGWQQAPFRFAIAQGLRLKKALVCADAVSLGALIVGTDLLAALPSRMAKRFQDTLVLRPYEFDTALTQHMYWAASTDKTPINRWVRAVLLEETKAIP